MWHPPRHCPHRPGSFWQTLKSNKKEISGSSLIQQILPGTVGEAGVESTTNKQKTKN